MDRSAIQKWVDRTRLKRDGRQDDIAGAALFLAGSMSSFINGHSRVVDGSLTIASGVALGGLGIDAGQTSDQPSLLDQRSLYRIHWR